MSNIVKVSKKKRKRQWPYMVLFAIGFIIFLYPQISNFYYYVYSNKNITKFDFAKSELSDSEVKRRLDLANAFNDSLVNTITDDPYEKKRHNEGRAEYARMLEVHEQIGHIQVPAINIDIPIYAGTTEETLQKGAGHLEGTSLPVGGVSTHTVITAHSGLPTVKLFSDLTKVRVGDRFYIHNLGTVLAYQIDQIKVIKPSNFNDLLIVDGQDYATLLTCTPIMINTPRLIVRGHRVPYNVSIDNKLIEESKQWVKYRYIFYSILALIILILLLAWRYKRLSKKYWERISAFREVAVADDIQ